eukprot:gene16032-33703_t
MKWAQYFLATWNSSDFYMVFGALVMIIYPSIGAFTLDSNSSSSQGQDPIVVSSMQSLAFKYTLVVNIAVSSQMLLDACLHNFSNLSNAFGTKGSILNFIVLLWLLLSSALTFFYAVPLKHYMFFLGLSSSRAFIVACTTACLAREYTKGIWSSNVLKFAVVLGSVSSAFKIVIYGQHWSATLLLSFTSGQLLATLIFFCFCIKWLIHLHQRS